MADFYDGKSKLAHRHAYELAHRHAYELANGEKIPPGYSGCWLWLGSVNSAGYGKLYINGKSKLAHRHAYELANGEKIPPGYVVMHSCDVRTCCNPNHLSIGTHGDNARDRADKHRDGNASPRPIGRRYW